MANKPSYLAELRMSLPYINNGNKYGDDDDKSSGAIATNNNSTSSNNDVLVLSSSTGNMKKKESSNSNTYVETMPFVDSMTEEEQQEQEDEDNDREVTVLPVLPNNDDVIVNSSTMTDNINSICGSSTVSEMLYPADTYSFLCLYGPIKNPRFFSYGLMVYLFQMTFLVLMVLSVIHPK